jgi:hypothetical protein
MTVAAVGFLLLDAVLLGVAAVWGGRPGLLAWSAAFVLLAVGVVVLRRRYLRRLEEIARARARLRQELRAVMPQRESSESA